MDLLFVMYAVSVENDDFYWLSSSNKNQNKYDINIFITQTIANQVNIKILGRAPKEYL